MWALNNLIQLLGLTVVISQILNRGLDEAQARPPVKMFKFLYFDIHRLTQFQPLTQVCSELNNSLCWQPNSLLFLNDVVVITLVY